MQRNLQLKKKIMSQNEWIKELLFHNYKNFNKREKWFNWMKLAGFCLMGMSNKHIEKKKEKKKQTLTHSGQMLYKQNSEHWRQAD